MINKQDQDVWSLIQQGVTKGIFQCESKLVQHWLKKIKPQNMWELSAVIASVRPGALESGQTEEYCAHKNKEKEIQSLGHHIIDEVFASTEGVLLYQESIMLLGARLAWPDLPDKERGLKVDELRKAIGKKNQEKILKIGKEFVEGAIRNKVDSVVANKLFEIIKNCGRYLFNLAHSFSYAEIAYETAYAKVHTPLPFFATYLSYAKFKQAHRKNGKEVGGKWNEIKELVYEANKFFNIKILPPNINSKNEHFAVEKGSIRFGLSHMKYFGASTMGKIRQLPKIISWQQFVLLTCADRFGIKLGKNSVEALIKTGSFSETKISRSTLLVIYNLLSSLTDREVSKLADLIEEKPEASIEELKPMLLTMADTTCNKNRKAIVSSEVQLLKLDLFDKPEWVELQEKYYLGLPLTATALDSSKQISENTCNDVHDNLPLYTKFNIALVIDEIKPTVTKKGKNPGQKMAFITGHDQSGQIEKMPIFPDAFAVLEDILIPQTSILLTICHGKGGWFVEGGQKLE